MGGGGMLSPAWLYKAFGSKPGVLQLMDGRLSFTFEGGGVLFDEPLERVEVRGWPSYGVAPDSQVKLEVAGKSIACVSSHRQTPRGYHA
jgi:hypothetical protein